MKIRVGFVSNSSASSFIVAIKFEHPMMKTEKNEPFLATTEDITKLEKYGFNKSNSLSPFRPHEDMSLKDDEGPLSMHFYTTCNQEEVIYFLVKNNIPFKASCHYNNYFVQYKKDADTILTANNFGYEICMYGDNKFDLKFMKEHQKPWSIENKEEWLEANKGCDCE